MFDFDNETVKGLLEPVSTLIRTIRGCVEQMCTNENGSDRAEPWGADWTGPRESSDAIDFQRIIFFVAFSVAVVRKNAGFLQKRTRSDEIVQK